MPTCFFFLSRYFENWLWNSNVVDARNWSLQTVWCLNSVSVSFFIFIFISIFLCITGQQVVVRIHCFALHMMNCTLCVTLNSGTKTFPYGKMIATETINAFFTNNITNSIYELAFWLLFTIFMLRTFFGHHQIVCFCYIMLVCVCVCATVYCAF